MIAWIIAIAKALPWRAMIITTIAAVSFGTGVLVTHWKHNSDHLQAELTRQHSEKLAREIVSKIAGETAAAIGSIRVENRTIYQTARTEILREPVYTDCLVPATGGVLVNEARGHDRSGADAAVPSNTGSTYPARRPD